MKPISRMVCLAFMAAVAVGLFLSRVAADETKAKEVKPIQEWKGRIGKEQQKEAPARGYIAGDKAWAKLWKDWKIKGELPKVDFDNELILVGTVQSNGLFIVAKLDDKGNLVTRQLETAQLKPDFAYLIAHIKRDGIKTINGKALERD